MTVTRLHLQKRDREWIFIGQAESRAELEVLQAMHAALQAGASQSEPSAEDDELEPVPTLPLVRCSECGAAQRVTDAERAPCPYCGQQVAMPSSHVAQVRDLRRSAAQQASIEAALRWLMREPPAPYVLWMTNARCLIPVAIVSPVMLYLSVDALLYLRFLDAILWAAITPLLEVTVL